MRSGVAKPRHRRTAFGHLQVIFVPKNKPARAPLTPLLGRPERPPRQRGWSKYNQRHAGRGGYPYWVGRGRGGRGRRRPCRPLSVSFSDRAPSLRELPLPFSPLEHVLVQCGTHFDAVAPLFAEHDPVCIGTLPPWFDEFGSNDSLFASGPPAALEGDQAASALPMTGER